MLHKIKIKRQSRHSATGQSRSWRSWGRGGVGVGTGANQSEKKNAPGSSGKLRGASGRFRHGMTLGAAFPREAHACRRTIETHGLDRWRGVTVISFVFAFVFAVSRIVLGQKTDIEGEGIACARVYYEFFRLLRRAREPALACVRRDDPGKWVMR
jgi:hypothetical protein